MSAALLATIPLLILVSLACIQPVFSRSQNEIINDGAEDTRELQVPIARMLNEVLPSDEVTSLPEIVREVNAQNLTADDRERVLDIAIKLIENFNPNYNIRNRFLGINPVAEMRLFRKVARRVSNFAFHTKMKEVFSSMNNGHTFYDPPPLLLGSYALLGFYIDYYVNDSTGLLQFVVSRKDKHFPYEHPDFNVGVTVLTIDDIPVKDLAIKLGEESLVSNDASRLRLGTVLLTKRFLAIGRIPNRKSAKITYQNNSGMEQIVNVPWIYRKRAQQNTSSTERFVSGQISSSSGSVLLSGIESLQGEYNPPQKTTKEIIFDNHPVLVEIKNLVPSYLKPFYYAATFNISNYQVAYLAVKSFGADSSPAAWDDLRNIVRQIPGGGLIIDIRDNPGGKPANVYALLKTFSNVTFAPSLEVYRASQLQVNFFKELKYPAEALRPFIDAVRLGESFTGPTILGSSSSFFSVYNQSLSPVFHGPVVTIANALSASASDEFTSFCRDYRMCYVINVDESTLGLGDNTVQYDFLQTVANKTFPESLPLNISIRTAWARYYRVGIRSGALISVIGVEPDEKYNYTRNDILNRDVDLLYHAGRQLMNMSF